MGKIDQEAITKKMQIFLVGVGESLPDWAWVKSDVGDEKEVDGLCEGFAFMMMRATLAGERKQYLERLQKLSDMDDKEIQALATLKVKYSKIYPAVVASESKSLVEKLMRRGLREGQIRKIKRNHHAAIRLKVKSLISRDNQGHHLYDFAEELYMWINSILFAHDPGINFGFKHNDGVLDQGRYVELYHLLMPDKFLYPKNKKKLGGITNVFTFAFVYKKSELMDVFEQVLFEGDHVRVGSTDHTMYLQVEKGIKNQKVYTLYDSNNQIIPVRSVTLKHCIDQMIEFFFIDYGSSTDFVPISLDIYRSKQSRLQKITRPSSQKLIQDMLMKRGEQRDCVNAASWDNTTPLSFAARAGDEKVVKLLIENRADVSITDNVGESAMAYAIINGNKKVVDLLLEYKAEIKSSHLILAGKYDRVEIMKILLLEVQKQKKTLYYSSDFGETLITQMISDKRYSIVEMMLNTKIINVNAVMSWVGDTLLMKAIRQRDLVLVKMLLKKGARVNYKNKIEDTPLFLAILYGLPDVVRELIKWGVDVTQGKSTVSPMASAVTYKEAEIIEILEEHKPISASAVTRRI